MMAARKVFASLNGSGNHSGDSESSAMSYEQMLECVNAASPVNTYFYKGPFPAGTEMIPTLASEDISVWEDE